MRYVIVGLLATHITLTGWVLPRFVRPWSTRSPSVALVLLTVNAAGFLLASCALGLVLAHDVLEHLLVLTLGADKTLLHLAYAGSNPVPHEWNGAVALPMAMVSAVSGLLWGSRRRARRQRAQFAGLCPEPGYSSRGIRLVRLPHDRPALWCLPGRPALVVATTAALDRLGPDELEAAVAHEVAHADRRHHVLVAVSDTIARVLRPVRALQGYPQMVRALVEMDADDRAARSTSRVTVLRALLVLGQSPHPSAAAGLALGETDTGLRARRLLAPQAAVARPRRWLAALASTALLAAPVVILAWPALGLVGTR